MASEAISTLVKDALRVADGQLPDLDTMMDQVANAVQLVGRHPDSRHAVLNDTRLCRLDPSRPGPDVLEDLLSAIWGCYLLWREYMWATGNAPDIDRQDTEDDDETARTNTKQKKRPCRTGSSSRFRA